MIIILRLSLRNLKNQRNFLSGFLLTHHYRYGGRGVMIYWHVEKNACCIHSQLKSVSSSEVSAMI